MNNELYHHGVKGQKWGIRRYQNYDGTRINKEPQKSKFELTDKQKKMLKIGAGVAVTALALYGGYTIYKHTGNGEAFRTFGLSDSLEKTLSDYPGGDIVLSSKQKLQRVSSKQFEDFKDAGHTYVSYKFRDNQRYKSGFVKEINLSGSRNYVHTLLPNHELKIASPRTAAEEYLRLYPNAKDNTFRFVTNPYGFNDSYNNDPIAKSISEQRRNLFKSLSDKGYSGIIDLEDASKHKNSAPIIVFNPGDHIKDSGGKQFGKIETFVADLLK